MGESVNLYGDFIVKLIWKLSGKLIWKLSGN